MATKQHSKNVLIGEVCLALAFGVFLFWFWAAK